jgi:carbon-monoxide dehydrogenase large subunit
MLPQATDVPPFALYHLESPSPNTLYGIKGVGEGGAIPPPAAVFNAVNDALRGLHVELTQTPLSPCRVIAALAEVEENCAAEQLVRRGHCAERKRHEE